MDTESRLVEVRARIDRLVRDPTFNGSLTLHFSRGHLIKLEERSVWSNSEDWSVWVPVKTSHETA